MQNTENVLRHMLSTPKQPIKHKFYLCDCVYRFGGKLRLLYLGLWIALGTNSRFCIYFPKAGIVQGEYMKKENIKTCHSRRFLSGIYDACSYASNHQTTCVEDPRVLRTAISGMTANGFTLIELLVVVLIIGILAAIALPQYQKAVRRARLTEAKVILKNLTDAQDMYYLGSGDLSQYLTLESWNEVLDIKIPSSTNWDIYTDECSNEWGPMACVNFAVPTWESGDYEIRYASHNYNPDHSESGNFRCAGSVQICTDLGARENEEEIYVLP